MAGMPLIERTNRELPAVYAGTWPWSPHLEHDLPSLFLVGPDGDPVLYRSGPQLVPGARGTLVAEETNHAELMPAALAFRAEGEPIADPFEPAGRDLRSRPGWLLLARALAPEDPRLKKQVREWRRAGGISGFDEAYFARVMGWTKRIPDAYEMLTSLIGKKEWAAAGSFLRRRREELDLRAAEIHNARDQRYRAPIQPAGKKRREPYAVKMSWAELLQIGTVYEGGRPDEAKGAFRAFRKKYPDWEKAFRYGPMEGFEPPTRELWKPDRPEALLRQIGGLWGWLNSGGHRK